MLEAQESGGTPSADDTRRPSPPRERPGGADDRQPRLAPADVLIRFAEVYLDRGEARGAVGCAERGLALSREGGQERLQVAACRVLGDALSALRCDAEAVTHWEAGLAVCARLGDLGEENGLRRRVEAGVALSRVHAPDPDRNPRTGPARDCGSSAGCGRGPADRRCPHSHR
jgi:hypothetical protein